MTLTTDIHGVFSTAAAGGSDRYVVTVTKPGYVPQSRIYDDGVGIWQLSNT